MNPYITTKLDFVVVVFFFYFKKEENLVHPRLTFRVAGKQDQKNDHEEPHARFRRRTNKTYRKNSKRL